MERYPPFEDLWPDPELRRTKSDSPCSRYSSASLIILFRNAQYLSPNDAAQKTTFVNFFHLVLSGATCLVRVGRLFIRQRKIAPSILIAAVCSAAFYFSCKISWWARKLRSFLADRAGGGGSSLLSSLRIPVDPHDIWALGLP